MRNIIFLYIKTSHDGWFALPIIGENVYICINTSLHLLLLNASNGFKRRQRTLESISFFIRNFIWRIFYHKNKARICCIQWNLSIMLLTLIHDHKTYHCYAYSYHNFHPFILPISDRNKWLTRIHKNSFSIGSCVPWTTKSHGSLPAYDTITQIMRICGYACNKTFHALLQIKEK